MDYNFTPDPDKESKEDKRTQYNIAALEKWLDSGSNYIDNKNDNYSTNFSENKNVNSGTSFFSGKDVFVNNHDDYLNSTFSDGIYNDPLEKTNSIDEVDLKQLREFSAKLHSIVENDDDNFKNDEGRTNTDKKKVLTNRNTPKYGAPVNNDVQEIVSSFINCFVLA